MLCFSVLTNKGSNIDYDHEPGKEVMFSSSFVTGLASPAVILRSTIKFCRLRSYFWPVNSCKKKKKKKLFLWTNIMHAWKPYSVFKLKTDGNMHYSVIITSLINFHSLPSSKHVCNVRICWLKVCLYSMNVTFVLIF